MCLSDVSISGATNRGTGEEETCTTQLFMTGVGSNQLCAQDYQNTYFVTEKLICLKH